MRAYLSERDTQRAIYVQFSRFLREFEDEHGETVYVGRIRDMMTGNLGQIVTKQAVMEAPATS